MRLIFSTNNEHKLKEIFGILGEKYKSFIYSLKDFYINIEPEETGKTYTENSKIKLFAAYDALKNKNALKSGDFILADDTGLSIDFLDGAPGIFSSRFLGKDTKQEVKNKMILKKMNNLKYDKRTAHFTTSITAIDVNKSNKILEFVGVVNGYIVENIENDGGFGYDPIFAVGNPIDIINGTVSSYSKLGFNEKNKISHRAIALQKFVEYLEKNHNI